MNAKVRDVMTPGPIGVDYHQSIGVIDAGQVAGVVSLGDLALEDDSGSALSQVSIARPNT